MGQSSDEITAGANTGAQQAGNGITGAGTPGGGIPQGLGGPLNTQSRNNKRVSRTRK